MLENVLFCSISTSVSHVPGNQGGFLQKINCHCSSYSRNHYSYILEKPRNIAHYLTLEEVGNCDRSITNFFHVACFDLWSSYDIETCILLRKSTDAARDSKETRLLIDTYLAGALPLLCGAMLPPLTNYHPCPTASHSGSAQPRKQGAHDPPPMRAVLTLS